MDTTTTMRKDNKKSVAKRVLKEYSEGKFIYNTANLKKIERTSERRKINNGGRMNNRGRLSSGHGSDSGLSGLDESAFLDESIGASPSPTSKIGDHRSLSMEYLSEDFHTSTNLTSEEEIDKSRPSSTGYRGSSSALRVRRKCLVHRLPGDLSTASSTQDVRDSVPHRLPLHKSSSIPVHLTVTSRSSLPSSLVKSTGGKTKRSEQHSPPSSDKGKPKTDSSSMTSSRSKTPKQRLSSPTSAPSSRSSNGRCRNYSSCASHAPPKIFSMEIWQIQKQLKRGEMVQGVLQMGSGKNMCINAPVIIGRTDGQVRWRI